MTCGCKECGDECQHTCGCSECNPCAEKKECCVPNIVADGDCISVTTDDKGVIHLATRCNPEIISSDNSVSVTVDKSGDIDVWDLKVDDKDHLVAACGRDVNPSTLDEKIVGVDGITVSPVCSENGRIEIGFDSSSLSYNNNKVAVESGCSEKYLADALKVDSKYIKASIQGCTMVLVDKDDAPLYYAKLVLKENHIINVGGGIIGHWEESLGTDSPVVWMPCRRSGEDYNVRSSLLSGLKFEGGTPTAPGAGWIKITKRGLYQVGFSGSAEFSYGVHAFRVQLYRIPKNNPSAYNTIVESRYSGPLGYEPWQPIVGGGGDINLNYVSNVNLRGDDTVSSVSHNSYRKRIDYPLISDKTEVGGMVTQQVYSQSLGMVMDRVTVTGNTIVELDVGDLLYVGLKVSTSVTHSGDILNNVGSNFKAGQFALLGIDEGSSDNGGEAGFSYYANLIHAL